MRLNLLDLDGSVARQRSLPLAADWDAVSVVPMSDLAASLRLWSGERAMCEARARLFSTGGSGRGPGVTVIGSGDFHHLAALGIEGCTDPITVVHFDNHPDWAWSLPRWHCGGWVNRVLELKQVARVVTIGPCSDDLVRPGLKGANLHALDDGSIVLFPWRHAPSRVWHRIGDGAGHRWNDGHIEWRNLGDRDLDEGLREVLDAVPTESIWISIDKDILPESEAVTNWDQGAMPLDAVLRVIDALGATFRLVGADICGEYAPPRFGNVFKRIESLLDQPRRDRVDPAALERNERANMALLGALRRACA